MKSVDIFYKAASALPDDLKQKLSIHNLKTIWDVMVTPAFKKRAAEIKLGDGSVECVCVIRDGRIGVLLRQDEHEHEIGSVNQDPIMDYTPREGDVVIWLTDPKSGEILKDEVQRTINFLNEARA